MAPTLKDISIDDEPFSNLELWGLVPLKTLNAALDRALDEEGIPSETQEELQGISCLLTLHIRSLEETLGRLNEEYVKIAAARAEG
ncbi:MAG TPA: hypothetical protein PKL48_09575 [Thermodesulfobacteriota bacterium]|nr:hypothetical protein [Thermodesulfobacteriota bacterium]